MTRRSRTSRLPFSYLLPGIAVLLQIGCASLPKTSITEIPEGSPLTQPDDSLYAHVLARAMQSGTAINYVMLQADSELTGYLRSLALVRTDVFTSRQQLLAFWLNAHNAYVLDLLRNNQPLTSIGDLSGFKSTHVALIGGKRYSLSEIEDQILTHDFREPRAFFALFDGSRSGPALRNEPYAESRLSGQLDEQVEEFLSDSTKNYLDAKINTLYLSDAFHHYREELDQWVGGTLRFVREFAPDAMATWIDRHSQVKISYLRVDETISATPYEHHEEHPASQPKRPKRKSSGGIE